MTDLSPQAQAVLDAANGKSSWGPDDVLNDSRWIAAAAIRAAAKQFFYDWNGVCCEEHLLAIADELEGDGPAVSDDREPASVVSKPTNDESKGADN